MDRVSLEALRKYLVNYLFSIVIIRVWLKKIKFIDLGEEKYLYYLDLKYYILVKVFLIF